MLAQKKNDLAPSVIRRPKKGKRGGLLRWLVRNPMACVLLGAAVITMALSVYVGAYANATKSGYHKSALQVELKSLNMENAALQETLEKLRQPGWIDDYAAGSGMQQPSKMVYLEPSRRPTVAKNLDGLD